MHTFIPHRPIHLPFPMLRFVLGLGLWLVLLVGAWAVVGHSLRAPGPDGERERPERSSEIQ